MKRDDFLSILTRKILVMDGAYGTEISRKVRSIDFPEEANIVSPEVVKHLHKRYIESGADIIKTNTFGVFHLLASGKIEKQRALNVLKNGVRIGKKVAEKNGVFCFASFGPMSDSIFKYTVDILSFFEDFYKLAVAVALEEKVDGILFETFSDPLELKLAVNSVREIDRSLPVIAQFTLNSSGFTIGGMAAENCGAFLESIDCDVAGLNCSTGAIDMADNFERFSKYLSKPLSASPNAGMPEYREGKILYENRVNDFVKTAPVFIKNGASIVGSCCGSNPSYTNALKKAVKDLTPVKREKKDFLVSPEFLIDFNKTDFLPVGERLNLLGNNTFKRNYLEDKKNAIEIELNRQLSAGARCVDFNVDYIAKDNPNAAMEDVLILQNIASPVISIDSLYPHVMSAIAKYAVCSPLFNSADLTEKRFSEIVKLYRRYGGKIIVLLMSGKKVPSTLNERLKALEVLDYLVQRFNVFKKDIFVDPLALTLGTDIENYSFVEKIVEKTDYKTIVGLSNFSHGLPDRSRLNSFLLTHLLRKGLDAAILDVSDPHISSVIMNHRAVFKKEGFFLDSREKIEFDGEYRDLGNMLLNGDTEKLVSTIQKEIEKGCSPSFLLENGLVKNMEKIGDYFDRGIIFLPQLLIAADSMKIAFEQLKPYLEKEISGSGEKGENNDGKIVLFTVQNDVHDIGKNIVLTVLKSFGFSVFDGGIDRTPDDIVEEVKTIDAKVVGLSALMTTSLPYMKKTVERLKSEVPGVKVIVGGAVVTKRFAQEIGADGYGKNAFEAVTMVRNLL